MDLLKSLDTPLNIGFLVAFGVVSIFLRWRRVPWKEWGGYYVTLGILGTFAGILQSLLQFDPNAIDASVPHLLEGMRTAFVTSVVGMGLAILTRMVGATLAKRVAIGEPTTADYYLLLQRQTEALVAIQQSIGGEGDKSIQVQMRLMRADMNEFMRTLQNQSVDAIIKALEKVVADFNQNLTTQFGENFQQLNQSVGRMIGWMEQHQQLIGQSHEALKTTISALQEAQRTQTSSAASMERVSAAVAAVDGNLRQTVETLSDITAEIQQLRDGIEALGGDAASLSENIEALDGSLTILVATNESLSQGLAALQEMAENSNDATNAMAQLAERSQSAITTTQAALSEFTSALNSAIDELSSGLGHAQAQQMEALTALINDQNKKLGETIISVQREIQEQTRTQLVHSGTVNKQAIDQQIQALQKDLHQQLTSSMEIIGGSMGSLSKKFAEDYGPLTEKLAQVVLLGQQAQQHAAGPHHHG